MKNAILRRKRSTFSWKLELFIKYSSFRGGKINSTTFWWIWWKTGSTLIVKAGNPQLSPFLSTQKIYKRKIEKK
jgi:hypothetical protein